MRKVVVIALCLLTLLSLCACAKVKDHYTTRQWGTKLEVDKGNQTIKDGTYTYRYKATTIGYDTSVNIYYPNGASYYSDSNRYSGEIKKDYVTGDLLTSAVKKGISTSVRPLKVVAVLFLLAVGILNIVSPYSGWYLRRGWLYKDAEPSYAALTAGRLLGFVCIGIAVILVFFW